MLINAGVYEYGSWFPSLAALTAHRIPTTITTLSHLDHACSRSFLAALHKSESHTRACILDVCFCACLSLFCEHSCSCLCSHPLECTVALDDAYRGEARLLPGAIDDGVLTEAQRQHCHKSLDPPPQKAEAQPRDVWPKVKSQGRNPFGATHITPLGGGAAYAARNFGFIHLDTGAAGAK